MGRARRASTSPPASRGSSSAPRSSSGGPTRAQRDARRRARLPRSRCVVGWWALRDAPYARGGPRREHAAAGRSWRERCTTPRRCFAFFALSNADIVVARNVLDDHDAGLYAGGLILTKAVLFLPQFVVVVAFPVDVHRRRAPHARCVRSLVAGRRPRRGRRPSARWLLSGVALVFVGGAEYAEIEDQLWLFAVLGTVLAMLQLLVYARARPPGPALGATGLGGAGRAGGARARGRRRHRRWSRSCSSSTRRCWWCCSPSACGCARQPGAAAATRRRPTPTAAQCAASCQLRPVPTETSSGTARSAAPPICVADQRLERVALPRRDLEHELVVHLEQHPRAQALPRRAPGRR